MKTIERIMMALSLGMVMILSAGCDGLVDAVPDGAEAVSAEAAEIASGKAFTVEKGEVTYQDGTIFTFKDYGKTWMAKVDNSASIHVDGFYYVVDLESGIGYKMTDSEGYGSCPFIFWEKLYKYGDQWGAELKESTETIAGKKCVVFTAPDGTVVAGWNRVLFKSDEFTAVSWSDNVSSDAFSVDKYNIMEY